MNIKAKQQVDDIGSEVSAALAFHDDDPRATVATLLADIRHLRLQLALAECAMSPGMTRGWRPRYEREDGDA